MKQTLTITRDYGLSHSVIGKLVCGCGWYEKFYEKDIIKMAKAHLRAEHGGGTIVCGDNEMEVNPIEQVQNPDPDGNSDRDTNNGAREGDARGVSNVPTRGWNPVLVPSRQSIYRSATGRG